MDTTKRRKGFKAFYGIPLLLISLFLLALFLVPRPLHVPLLPSLSKPAPPEEPVCDCSALESKLAAANARPTIPPSDENWVFDPQRDANNYGLSQEQCDAAFPGLFAEIEDRVHARTANHITEEELSRKEWPWGVMRCMIYDGILYVIDTNRSDLRRSRQFSTLLAMSRAILGVSNLERIPNVEFVISIEDFTADENLPVWAYDRKADQRQTWLMPDFGFWGWPEPGVGTYAEVRRRMADVEKRYESFEDKEKKLFWRGAIVPAVAPVLRQHLVDQVKGQPWADVDVLVWDEKDANKKHRVPIEDHCRYQYLVNTEGRAWSGRLKYIQNCESVLVAHTLEWILPHTHLMISEGEDQNYVAVDREFTDLNSKMEHYLAHPEAAQRIAENGARTFRDRHLTPAAEACYWRKLIHGWSQVSFEPRFYDDKGGWRGVPFDSYVLMRQLHWEPT